MKVCPNCKQTYGDEVAVCSQCGVTLSNAVPQAYPVNPQASTDHTAEFQKDDISQNKVLAMLPYLMGWIGIIITLLAAGTSAYAGFHVRQALKIQVCTTLVAIIGAIIPFIGWLAIGIFGIIALVINIICFFSVCKGEAKEPPIVSSLGFLK